jgi:putative acetyltransferase
MQPNVIEIRDEETKDEASIREVLVSAFPTEDEAKLVEALRNNGKVSLSLVAEKDGTVVGHIMFSLVTVNEAQGIGLGPLAVRADHQNQGIGSMLIREGLSRCQGAHDFCVVLGAPGYYGKFGFQRASDFGLQNEYGVDEEFRVVFWQEVKATGLVRYGDEFKLVA